MNIGFSGEAFGNLLILSAIISLVGGLIVFIVAKRKGIDVTTRSFQLSVGLSLLIVLGIIPLWLTDLTVKQKTVVTILALVTGVGNYFAVDRMQRVLREQSESKKMKDDNQEK